MKGFGNKNRARGVETERNPYKIPSIGRKVLELIVKACVGGLIIDLILKFAFSIRL